MITVERFDAEDGDHWYSVVIDGELATCVMHDTEEAAQKEADELV